MGRVPMMFVVSRGVDVAVLREGAEVLWVKDGVAVSVYLSHRFVASETSPVIKSIFFVDYEFVPEMSFGKVMIFMFLIKRSVSSS